MEFRSVVDAVRCAIEVQSGMIERNAGLPPEKRNAGEIEELKRKKGDAWLLADPHRSSGNRPVD